jgi:hypothetical protein
MHRWENIGIQAYRKYYYIPVNTTLYPAGGTVI